MQKSGRLTEAEAVYRRILSEVPNQPDALHLLGAVARTAGRTEEAVDLFRRSLSVRSGSPQVWFNLATSLLDLGRYTEAAATHRRAIALKPDFVRSWCGLGQALGADRKLDAAAAYRNAIGIRPDDAKAWYGLASALKALGEPNEAVAAVRRAIALDPGIDRAFDLLFVLLNTIPDQTARTIADEQSVWDRQISDRFPRANSWPGIEKDAEKRLRIGLVSPDFRRHPVANFLLPYFAASDRANFEILCYSDVAHPDPTTQRLREMADGWRETNRLSDEALASLIRDDRIDLLVDLTMHMAHNRLAVFARKPAPVQSTWLAYPGGTGLTAVDYRLSDL